MLKRKMFRDIKNNISQFISIFSMVMIGVLAYTGIEAYMDGMQNSGDKFYDEYNLEDLIAYGKFNDEIINDLKSIDGINDINGKLSVTAMTGEKTLLMNFISENTISKFYVDAGEEFSSKNGVWLDTFFAKENNIKVGDKIKITYGDITLNPEVLGLIYVPDHVYDVKDESELFPNKKEFGFAYMNINSLDSSMRIFNSIMIDTNNKADTSKVKESLESHKEVLGVIKVEDTASYSTYQGEINEGKSYVGIFSGLFLFIAFLSVITTMTRVIKKERKEIAILKALGYSNFKIIMHYTSYVFFISLLGSALGIIIGYFGVGNIFINMEMSYFEVPNGAPVLNIKSIIMALAVVLLTSLVTILSSISILKESPADSLRPEAPNAKTKKSSKCTFNKMSFSTKWNLRDVFRNKIRTIGGIIGITSSCALIVCAFGMLNSINYFIKLQFKDLYNFKYKLSLNENITKEETNELISKYESTSSETLNIEIILNDEKETNNLFVTDAGNYVRFIDENDNFMKIDNERGVYVTRKLASENNLKVGDTIKWKVYGNDKIFESKIVGLNKDPQNQNMTATKGYLESLGITYKPDTLYTNKNLENVDKIDKVDVIKSTEGLEKGMNKMLNTMKSMIVLIIFIAIVLGSVIIYNMGLLSFTEKTHQFATLKVLGFSDRKIKKIFVKQNVWILIISIILGMICGKSLVSYLFAKALDAHYDFNAYIELSTYIISALGTSVVTYLTMKLLSRKINEIDMVSSLKESE